MQVRRKGGRDDEESDEERSASIGCRIVIAFTVVIEAYLLISQLQTPTERSSIEESSLVTVHPDGPVSQLGVTLMISCFERG